jgi:hypothetical protein
MGMTTNLNRRVLDWISMYPSKNSLLGYRATHKVDQNLVTFMLLNNLSQVGVADNSKAEYGGGTQEQMVDVENPRRRFVSISSLVKLTSSRNMGNSVGLDSQHMMSPISLLSPTAYTSAYAWPVHTTRTHVYKGRSPTILDS